MMIQDPEPHSRDLGPCSHQRKETQETDCMSPTKMEWEKWLRWYRRSVLMENRYILRLRNWAGMFLDHMPSDWPTLCSEHSGPGQQHYTCRIQREAGTSRSRKESEMSQLSCSHNDRGRTEDSEIGQCSVDSRLPGRLSDWLLLYWAHNIPQRHLCTMIVQC